MKIFKILLTSIIILLFLCGCSDEAKQNGEIYDCFDTYTVLTAYCSDEEFERFFTIFKNEFERLHKIFDRYNEYEGVNNLYLLNASAQEDFKPEPELFELISEGVKWHKESGGRLNIALGALIECYNSAFNQERLPYESELKSAAKHIDINDIKLNSNSKTVKIEDSELIIDVGAIAKGYALDKAADALLDAGLENFLINAGGSIKAYGAPPGKDGWTVGLKNPTNNEIEAKLCVNGGSVATSAGNQRYHTVGGIDYPHIYDPITLKPVSNKLSATIHCSDSLSADALSTILYILPPEECSEYGEKYGEIYIIENE